MSEPTVKSPANDYINDLTCTFHLDPERTALVIVDMQYATGCRTEGLGKNLTQTGQEHLGAYRFVRIEQVVVPTIQRLLAFWRGRGLRVIYLTIGSRLPDFRDMPPHMRKLAQSTNNTEGRHEHEILDELKPLPGELVVNKTTVSAFNSSDIDAVLRTLGISCLVFTGISTNMCVDTTARDAADRGYHCLLVEDGCGAKEEYHQAAIVNFQRLFGRVAAASEVIAELSEAAPATRIATQLPTPVRR